MVKPAHLRLALEYRKLQEEPVDLIQAKPQDDNMLKWHFIMEGPPGTPYAGGQYYGQMIFSSSYPWKPPGLKFITPSGRFEPGTTLCLSMSGYDSHNWNSKWSVPAVLNGLLNFMNETGTGIGSFNSNSYTKKSFASGSRKFNNSNATFINNFPEVYKLNRLILSKGNPLFSCVETTKEDTKPEKKLQLTEPKAVTVEDNPTKTILQSGKPRRRKRDFFKTLLRLNN